MGIAHGKPFGTRGVSDFRHVVPHAYLLARIEVFSLCENTFVVVDIRLPAVLRPIDMSMGFITVRGQVYRTGSWWGIGRRSL
jgi:hypothetical protein